MQFQVPQFIEIEDKIFGPLTFKQFLYLAGGAGLCFLWYAYLGFYLGLIPMIATAVLAISLAFYKYNSRPFIYTLQYSLKYFLSNKLYIWKKKEKEIKRGELQAVPSSPKQTALPKLSQSKLKDLAWSLNVKDENI